MLHDFLSAVDICLRYFLSIACLLLPFRGRFELARVWARVILTVLRWTCRLDYRVEGRENLPTGNHIALIKHSSSWETVAQALLLPPHVWVLKRELTWIPFVGWGIRLLRAIAVDRGSGSTAVRGVLEQGKARLAEGKWIVIFPEGTRMPRRDAQVRRQRRAAGGRNRMADRADRARCRLLLAATRTHQEAGHDSRRHRAANLAAGRNPRDVNAEAQAWIEAHSTR